MKSKKSKGCPSAKEIETRDLRFTWIVFSVMLIVYMSIVCALHRAGIVTAAAAAVSSLIGAGAYAVIEKFGDRIWDML